VKVVFLGSQEIGARCLEVIVRSPHEVVGVATFRPEAHETWTDDVARVADAHGLPRLRGRRFRTRKAVDALRALAPDILFAIGWRWILPPEVLAIPPRGCLGIHGSLLPRLRGFAPVNWALIRDEPRTGPTLFHFDEGMDTGDVVGQRPFDLTDADDAGTVRARLVEAAVALLEEHLPGLAAGTAPRTPQREEDATYGPQRTPADGRIDWSRDARAIFNWVRGQTRPYPGAFTALGGRTVRVWAVRPAAAETGVAGAAAGAAEPGAPLPDAGERLLVGTGAGAVEILDAAFDDDHGPDPLATVRRELAVRGRFDG
jgi:methionyl-tRNA formyltransferase